MTTKSSLEQLAKSLKNQIIGQHQVIDGLLIALIANGHVLLEGLPGTAKTRSVKTLSASLGLPLGRIQFTPDLMPSDVVGYESMDSKNDIVFQKGPVFANILLADEINRAPPKVQSALLEAMEERQVTVSGKSYKLPELFLVLATQNPIEQEGTYPLPEAQLDRFLLKVEIDYPSEENELKILQLLKNEEQHDTETLTIDSTAILAARKELSTVFVSESIEKYIVDLVMATRNPQKYSDSELKNWIAVGSSPRATIALDRCARAYALINNKSHVDPEDVRAIAKSVIGHRLILSFDAIAEGISSEDIVTEIIKVVPVL